MDISLENNSGKNACKSKILNIIDFILLTELEI